MRRVELDRLLGVVPAARQRAASCSSTASLSRLRAPAQAADRACTKGSPPPRLSAVPRSSSTSRGAVDRLVDQPRQPACPCLDLLAQRDQRQPAGRELVGLVEHGERLVLVALAGEEARHRLRRRAARSRARRRRPRCCRARPRRFPPPRRRCPAGVGDQRAVIGDEEAEPFRALELVQVRRAPPPRRLRRPSPRRSSGR